ncbi:MAG: FAD-binding protein [Flavobacterium sp.]|nr:MAG: FAD-binding protein [Flavobacterium sp.]
MDTIIIGHQTYYLPASITDVQTLITRAFDYKLNIRVRGSHHSVSKAVFTDDNTDGRKSLNILLSRMNSVKIDGDKNLAIVGAGCHLGGDPFDPTQTSTWQNSLFARLEAADLALPDMGGIMHQTVGGFLATGSAGGSTKFAFFDALESITFLPANQRNPQPIIVNKDDPKTKDLFYATGVSMGLLGIIVSATFKCEKSYIIRGDEAIMSIEECPIDITGSDSTKQSLKAFLTETEYSRILWYPQPHVSRVAVWKVHREQKPINYKPHPYVGFGPFFGSEKLAQFVAGSVFSAIGTWPKWLGDIFGTNSEIYRNLTAEVSDSFYEKIFPIILRSFVKLDSEHTPPKPPQQFDDHWFGLAMDNKVGDKLFPVAFTELWIPFSASDANDRIAEVMQELNKLFVELYKRSPAAIPEGAFCVELYAGKKSDFWMSPSYGTHVFRVDVFWFENNLSDPIKTYFPLFWDALEKFGFRPHWGKYLPPPHSGQGPSYLQMQYPKWDDFLRLREELDPRAIFLSKYWRDQLGIAYAVPPEVHTHPDLSVSRNKSGYFEPENKDDIITIVNYAREHGYKIRVRGAGQSVSSSIYADSFQPDEYVLHSANINIMLNQLRAFNVDVSKKQVTVGAGWNLGYDPYDPSETSTPDNALLQKLHSHHLALMNVTSTIHQTVGGFISTGSSAGSCHHSFLEQIVAVTLIDGAGLEKTFTKPSLEQDCDFYGVVVSMGLMGIIYSVTLQCVDSFHIKGTEVIVDDRKDEFGDLACFPNRQTRIGLLLPDLQKLFQDTEFCRIIWWPFPTAKRAVIWEAHKMALDEYDEQTGPPNNFTPKPYRDAFYPSFLPPTAPKWMIEAGRLLNELVISTIFSIIGDWPDNLKGLGNTINILGTEYKTAVLQQEAEKLWPKFFPKLLDFFLPCDPENIQEFWDNWADGLTIDKYEFQNNLLPAYRTEFWVPLGKAQEVICMLNSYYKHQFFPNANLDNKNAANSCFVVELLGAKSNGFWMSPGYHQESLRICLNGLEGTNEDVTQYFQQFWDLFYINGIDFRLHWGYFLPKPESPEGKDYLKKRYPRWNEFLALRARLDPDQLFVNEYWKNQLGI